ncbi:hypothetical protein CCHL11_09236 [Colletotrichum chlorophyti]|uniref:Uncharacterized protein n=1 Tax=Colletotrichum chlorophyti TaxID=708187 RepID=A0A1Q8RCQ4_9PEZI|nr:hypothetical protein CCHL11_09236 [Colletotrichum chlorophyti]
MEPGYDAVFFSDPGERSYFDFWRILVGNIFLFPSEVMARTLPQLARQEPAIKHAAIAMAAMARAIVPSVRKRTQKELYANGPHYEFALKHYVQAIKLVRISKPSSDNMLWAIVCCVLFVTFECLHGDRNAALSHVDHAYKMMENYFKHRSMVEGTRGTDSIRAVCDDAAWVFHGMTIQSWSHSVLHSKDPSKISWCCRGHKRKFAIEEMPPAFSDVNAARRWWRVVQHYTCHRCPIFTEMFAEGLSNESLVGSYIRPDLPPEHVEELQAVLPEFVGHVQRWLNGFQPIYDHAQAEKDVDLASFIDACNLRQQYLTLWTELISLSHQDVVVMRTLTPSFREMVHLSRIILEAQSNCGGCSEVFSMDNGPTWPLLQAACRCHDAKVRQDATELLGKYHRRDGIWDSRAFHGLAVRCAEMEMGNAVSGGLIEQWPMLKRHQARVSSNGDVICGGKVMRWSPDTRQWQEIDN